MKRLYNTLTLIALFGVLAYTNPSLNNYDDFISQKITEKARKQSDPVVGALGSLLGSIAANLLTTQTARKDYIFFSTYDTMFLNKRVQAIGILNNFFITDDSAFKHND